MSQTSEQPFVCPEGLAFLKLVFEQEDAYEEETRRHIPDLGKKTLACFQNLGQRYHCWTAWQKAKKDPEKGQQA